MKLTEVVERLRVHRLQDVELLHERLQNLDDSPQSKATMRNVAAFQTTLILHRIHRVVQARRTCNTKGRNNTARKRSIMESSSKIICLNQSS